uniref:Uncharacterized protein n=1 Tax=Glossina brevipalpis TaxID=37001 RepID=A0A1A9WI85_9MUSC
MQNKFMPHQYPAGKHGFFVSGKRPKCSKSELRLTQTNPLQQPYCRHLSLVEVALKISQNQPLKEALKQQQQQE